MAAISITDLNNAKLDTDHIKEMATSLSATCVDRLGHVKQTMSAAGNAIAQTAAGTATTARIAAEAARDAALISSGVYTTEAVGRAAVADGVAFKVQGSGDVAAYEYRRVNAATVSTLIATYPSKGYIDSGRIPAGTAVTAQGAGYEAINPSAPGYAVTVQMPGTSLSFGVVDSPITLTKVATTGSATWFGVHLTIPYTSLAELNKTLFANISELSGMNITDAYILAVRGDWNPANKPIGISVPAMRVGGAGVNIYTAIMASAHAATYPASGALYVLIAGFNATSSVIDAAVATWTLLPRFSTVKDVIATSVVTSLRTSLTASAMAVAQPQLDLLTSGLSAVSNLTVVQKTPISAPVGVKFTAASTATIDAVYTRADPLGVVNIGFDTYLINTLNYVYAYAKMFDNYDTSASTKKFRFFVSSNGVDATAQLRLTNGGAWGSSDGKTGMLYTTTITFNAANNHQAIIEYDFSAAAAVAFYADANKYRGVYFMVALDGIVTSTPVKYSTYCYDVTAEAPTNAMTSGYVPSDNLLSPVQNDVIQLQTDLDLVEADVAVLKAVNGITCWGDSLTAGGGWTTTLQTLSGLPVYNGGTGGENSACILARQGGDVMVVNNITIPATTTAVQVASRPVNGGVKTAAGFTVLPLLQGGAHVNPCKIGDVVGTLTWTGSSYADLNGVYNFTRTTAGTAVPITRPTAIRTDYDMNRTNGIQILFIGQNGGYTDDADLIRQHRLMIEHSTAKATIILGLSSGSAASRAAYETAMKLAFGRYFISLREYLAFPIYTDAVITSCYGLQDAGITPTAGDLTAIASGTVPASLLSDSVHFNTACKTVIGNMLYAKMRDLNIL